jgi:hypothetical protein
MRNVTTSGGDSNAVGLRLSYDKVKGNGEIEPQKTYGGSGFVFAHSIQQTQNGGYVGSGSTESYGAGNTDVWVLKLDTFDSAKPRFLNRGKKHRSVSTLSIPRASDRGVEWVDCQWRYFRLPGGLN